MDLRKDDLVDVAGIVNTAENIRHSILVKAKTKKAQKISDAGGYLTLSPYQKTLIPIPEYVKAANIPADVAQKSEPIPATEAQVAAKAKNYLPYILGLIGIGIVVYLISKK
jgi:hypothetical protein